MGMLLCTPIFFGVSLNQTGFEDISRGKLSYIVYTFGVVFSVFNNKKYSKEEALISVRNTNGYDFIWGLLL
jgi:hypothetical protein